MAGDGGRADEERPGAVARVPLLQERAGRSHGPGDTRGHPRIPGHRRPSGHGSAGQGAVRLAEGNAGTHEAEGGLKLAGPRGATRHREDATRHVARRLSMHRGQSRSHHCRSSQHAQRRQCATAGRARRPLPAAARSPPPSGRCRGARDRRRTPRGRASPIQREGPGQNRRGERGRRRASATRHLD